MIFNLLLVISFVICAIAFFTGEGLVYLPLALISLAFVGRKDE